MNRRLLSATGSLCLFVSMFSAGHASASCNASTNPPASQTGGVTESCNGNAAVRVLPQDGAGNDVSPTHPLPVTSSETPSAVVYTDTVKSLSAAADSILLAAATTNKSVCLMNIGLNPVTITNGASAAVVGNGQALSPASGTGQQGGGYCFPLPPTNAIHGISTLGTTVIVTVGQ